MARHREEFSVREMCQVLKVWSSGFYAFLSQPDSTHALYDAFLKRRIAETFNASRCLYGSPRVYRELLAEDVACSQKRVARMMKEMGLCARSPRRWVRTTDSKHGYAVSPNRLDREYQIERVPGLDRAWAGDITYIPTAQGWLYLAVVLDLKSRRVIGWSMDDNMKQSLVGSALEMATKGRLGGSRNGQNEVAVNLLFHSDRGSQYAAHGFQDQLRSAGITGSMSRKGNCWDNAPVESFFATLKKELVHKVKYQTRDQAKASLFNYIEIYYRAPLISPSFLTTTCSYNHPFAIFFVWITTKTNLPIFFRVMIVWGSWKSWATRWCEFRSVSTSSFSVLRWKQHFTAHTIRARADGLRSTR